MSIIPLGTLGKADKILALYGTTSESLSFSEIVDRSGLEKGSVQRLLVTLQDLGLLRKHQRYKRYSLSPRFVSLAVSYCQSDPLIQRATAYLEPLAQRTTEAVSVCIPDDVYVFFMTRIENLAHRLFALQPTRLYAYCTAGGRAMLSAMPTADARAILERSPMRRLTANTLVDCDEISRRLAQYREEDLAWQDGEVIEGEIGLAAPILGEGDFPVAAVVMSIRRDRFDLEAAKERFGSIIKVAAQDLSSHAFSVARLRSST